ncbi:hypothetical protein [Halorhabdus sp. BNX81]|uniref:hypothetical protein n=1 Tax=Halorhabdus sp. BNX81 TaxID=2980181 RepID=UPI0023DD5867|nr:hypothetical protein [Halorhabdus sp. BNX81]WEL21682.1 Uncharacterized protein HBNXHr_1621 [Halorhabdus sp. BNX81]
MVDLTRRRLLAGVTTTALAGCMGDPNNQSSAPPASTASDTETPTPTDEPTPTETPTPETDEITLPEDLVAVLDPIPESVDGTSVSRIRSTAPSPDNDESFNQLPAFGSVSQIGLELDEIDRAAAARYGDYQTQIVTIVGSFDAEKPTLPEEAPIEQLHREDGRLIVAMDDTKDGWKDGLTAATEAAGDGELPLSEDARLALSPVSESAVIQLLPSIPADETGQLDGVNTDVIEAFAFGGDRLDPMTARVSITTVYTEQSDFDTEEFKTFAKNIGAGNTDDLTVERDGRVGIGTLTVQAPTQEIRERAPDPHLTVSYEQERGTARLEHYGEQPLQTESLTLFVDDEPVEDAWNGDPMEPDSSISVDADPLSSIMIEWTDPENPEFERIVFHDVIARGVTFEETYDIESKTLTVTYTGSEPVDRTDHVEIEHRSPEEDEPSSDETTESLADRHDRLTEGDQITIEGVAFGDRVTLMATHSYERAGASGSLSSSVYTFRAQVPGHFRLDTEEGPRLVYYGKEGRDPANFRVTVGGEEPATGFAEKYDTLERVDTLQLDAETGDEVVVEWVGNGGPTETFSEYVRPPASFELTRTTDGFEIVYRSEVTYDADAFAVRTGGGESDPVFADDYDTLEGGDSAPIELDGTSPVHVYWTEPEERITLTWLHLDNMLQFELDGSSLVFSGQGEWPAEEFDVTVDGEDVDGFTDTVTNGDSIDLSAETGSTVEVTWTGGDEPTSVFSETVHPAFEFTFAYDAESESLSITSKTDAELDPSELEIVVHRSDDRQTYVDAWREAYDVVETGDAVTLSVSGVEAAVVEHESWNVYAHKELE